MVAYCTKQRLVIDITREIDNCGCDVCCLFGNRDMFDGNPCVYLIKRPIRVFVTEHTTGFVYVVRVTSYDSVEVEYFDSYFPLEQQSELVQFLHWMYDITA